MGRAPLATLRLDPAPGDIGLTLRGGRGHPPHLASDRLVCFFLNHWFQRSAPGPALFTGGASMQAALGGLMPIGWSFAKRLHKSVRGGAPVVGLGALNTFASHTWLPSQ